MSLLILLVRCCIICSNRAVFSPLILFDCDQAVTLIKANQSYLMLSLKTRHVHSHRSLRSTALLQDDRALEVLTLVTDCN